MLIALRQHPNCSDEDVLRGAASLENLTMQMTATAGVMLAHLEQREVAAADKACELLAAYADIADDVIPSLQEALTTRGGVS